MKRRIEELVNGIYEYKAPEIEFSTGEIQSTVKYGEKYFGSFTIKNSEQKKMKGFLYSSNARVACEPREFSGLEPKISFDVDFSGMKAGDVLQGEFTVCTNMGEKALPFRFAIEAGRMEISEGEPLNLENFVRLAKDNYEKAYALFCSGAFGRMVEEQYPEYEALYLGLKNRSFGYESMEEFLIGAEKKDAVHFDLRESEHHFEEVVGSLQESVEIVRSGWGAFELEISSDAAFLQPSRSVISADDFLGSSYRLEYLIDPLKMHAGNNFGRITIKSARQSKIFEVTAKKMRRFGEEKELHSQKRAIECLYQDYLAFRLKRINLNTWITRAEDSFARYDQANGKDIMVRLYQAQIDFAAGQSESACTLLERLEQKHAIPNAPSVQGYYQYLTTLYDKDKKYVDYVEEKIKELYLKNQEEWLLQWVLLYLDENLIQHPSQKLEAIRRQYERGCRSRLMYLEACMVILKSPLLLKKLDSFEIQVLRFMCRNDLIDKEIVMQVADLAGRMKRYEPAMYQILCHCHSKYPSKSAVNAICSLLIKGHKVGPSYFNWYEKGVAQGLRLTGLYEYYIEAMGKERKGLLPQMVRMYFSYDNTSLGYEKKAVLYNNIIENREYDERTYESYRPAMEKFMVDQLLLGRVNRELARLYEEFLTKAMLNARMAENLSHALFTCEIRCDSEQASGVAVVHRQLYAVQMVNLSGHVANVQIYTKDAWIFVVDREGRWHAKDIPYTVEKLLNVERMFAMCRETIPDSPGFLLYACTEAQRTGQITGEKIKDFCGLLDFVDIQKSYKRRIRQDILDYYYANPKDDALYEYLHTMDRDAFADVDKGKTVELLIREGMCREAFDLVARFGPEKVALGALVRLCSRSILEREKEDDEMLLYLCHFCFSHGKYDEAVLTYLLSGYDGPVETMKKLWEAGKEFELDTMILEEKILIMLLFERIGLSDTEKIFESYRRKYGKKLLLNGYLNLMSYEYFVKDLPVEDPVFAEIERRMKQGSSTDLACRLALLKYYAGRETMDETQRELMIRILQECNTSHKCFAFFEKIEPSLLRSLQLWDRSIIEYRTNPGAKVMLTYTVENGEEGEGRERTEMMQDVYEGIFEKDFTLFYGEKLTYTICEEFDGKKTQTEERVLLPREWEKGLTEGTSRYQMINDMCRSYAEHRESQVKEQARKYLEKEMIVEHFFPVK